MPEVERVTHIKMADGTLAPVKWMTDESEWPEDVRRLAYSAREASRDAIRRLQAAGIPAYYCKGKDLVRLMPDGHEEIVTKDLLK